MTSVVAMFEEKSLGSQKPTEQLSGADSSVREPSGKHVRVAQRS